MHSLFRTRPENCCRHNFRTIKVGQNIASLAHHLRRKQLFRQPSSRDGEDLTGSGYGVGAAYQRRCLQTSTDPTGLISHTYSSKLAKATKLINMPKPLSRRSTTEIQYPEPEPPATIVLVDNEKALKEMLLKLRDLPVKPPSLYIDAEGHNLGRKGSLALLQILATPLKCTFVIDIHVLKEAAFTTYADDSTTTLKTILESDRIPKVIFDARNDSDNLSTEYGIRLGGVRDLQLMEYFSRPGDPGSTVLGLLKCIEKHLFARPDVIQKWNMQKEKGRILYNPRYGGSPDVFTKRPLSPTMLRYAAGDVEHMSVLYRRYRRKLPPRRWKWVLEKSRQRAMMSDLPTSALEHDRRWVAPRWTGNWEDDAEEPDTSPHDDKSSLVTASLLPKPSSTKTPNKDTSGVVSTMNSTVESQFQMSRHHSTTKGPIRRVLGV